jgi:beta-glucosidase
MDTSKMFACIIMHPKLFPGPITDPGNPLRVEMLVEVGVNDLTKRKDMPGGRRCLASSPQVKGRNTMKRLCFSLVLLVGLSLLLGASLGAESAEARPATQTALGTPVQQPYPGPDAHPIPGKIEAEDYDTGGKDVAYHDNTPGNYGGQYRGDDVDIEAASDTGGGYSVGWTEQGEWLRYTIHIAEATRYDIQVRVASAVGRTVSDTLPIVGSITWTVPLTKTLHVELDGNDITGPLTFLTTGGWQSWNSVFTRGVPLPAGEHRMHLVMDSGSFNVNWVWISKTLDDPVNELIRQMTITEKIAQLCGSGWMETADNVRLGIQGFRYADGPHGIRDGKATAFPVDMAMAATWDPDLVTQVGAALGEEARGKGKNQVLGPCVDITRDPRNGRSPESAGEEPYLAGKIGAAIVRGIQSTQAIATPKHLLAKNHQTNRRSANYPIDARTWREFYGLPFRMAVQQGGAWSIMSAYNWINGRPSSANRELLTEILRDEWGFDGYVVSDWDSIYTSAAEAIKAGLDLEMPYTPGKFCAELEGDIARGEVSIETLDRAVERILRTKQAAGMLDSYPLGNPSDVCSPAHRALALKVAQESITLLKNEDQILPLDKTQPLTIALVGPSADVAQLDGWGSSAVDACYAYTPKQGIANRTTGYPVKIVYAKGCDINSADTGGFPEAIAAARAADVVVFVGGLDNTQEGEERDRVGGSVQLPGQQQALINALATANPNLIVVLESGGVVALEQSIANIKGLLFAAYPGLEGGNALADVLFGDVNPSGKLPVTMPRNDAQLPAWDDLDFSGDLGDGFGYRRFDSLGSTPQYAFGHGLSYTTFAYGNLTVAPAAASADTPILVSVAVTNTGARAGAEIVQLYLSVRFADPVARTLVPMPVKQLRGFQRITLAPGQTQTVTFTLGPEELSFWSVSDNSFRIEPGAYTVRVGGSSDNLPLSAVFNLTAPRLYDSATGQTAPAQLPILADMARHRPVTCSSIEKPGLACENAVDGDLATRWSSEFSDPQWIYVDLGASKHIERIILRWEAAYAPAYRIETSSDAIAWTELYSTTTGDGEVDNLAVSGASRYVRMHGTQRVVANWGYSLLAFEVYGQSHVVYLPLVLRNSSSPSPTPTPRPVSILVDDFEMPPHAGESIFPFNRVGGDRGSVNGSSMVWGRGQITSTIAPEQTWGGGWLSLNHKRDAQLPIDFSRVLPVQILAPYQSQITGLTVQIARGTADRLLRLELKDHGALRWAYTTTLTGAAQIVSVNLPTLGMINELLWVMDQAAAGDFVVLDSIAFTATTPITDTATAAFVWSYGMLLNNWNPATGLARDKGQDASGQFDAIQATGSLAAATAQASQLGVIARADAIQIVSRISNTLLLDLPRFRGLWPHFTVTATDGITIAWGTEWSTIDTVLAAVGLLTAQNGLGLDTSGTEQMLRGIDWADLTQPNGMISMGYEYDGRRAGYEKDGQWVELFWDTFGGESWLVELAYVSAIGQVAQIRNAAPPTANGSGFIDELAWLLVPPPARPDYWGTDWPVYRSAAADKLINYYPSNYPAACFTRFGLFGLSAAEVPVPGRVLAKEVYQGLGVGGRSGPANDGATLLGAPVVVPHYAALIASLRPVEVTRMWAWLIQYGYFSPLNNVESLMFPVGAGCDPASAVWNQLKGSWNLALQTLGWGRYLAERRGEIPVLWQATTANALLRRGYRLLAPAQ